MSIPFSSFRLLALSGAFSVLACAMSGIAAAEELRAVSIKSAPVYQGYVLDSKVIPYRESKVFAPRDGQLTDILLWPGDKVELGERMAYLNQQELKEQKIKLQSEYNDLSGHLRRVEGLVQRELISDEIWGKNIHRLTELSAELAIINEKLKNSVLLSPASGVVMWSAAEAGKQVKGADPLYVIGDPHKFWLGAQVPAEVLNELELKDKVAVSDVGHPEQKAVLGTIDFKGSSGPDGKSSNLYISVPRSGALQEREHLQVLVAAPGEAEKKILPAQAVIDGEYVWALTSVEIEPHRYRAERYTVDVKQTVDGVTYFEGRELPNTTLVLLNPPEGLKYDDVVTVYEVENKWDERHVASVLGQAWSQKNSSPSACAMAAASAPAAPLEGESVATPAMSVKNDTTACLVPAALFNTDDSQAVAIKSFIDKMKESAAQEQTGRPRS